MKNQREENFSNTIGRSQDTKQPCRFLYA
uniref:Uncharacterized protein n=1 Tax=Rhizophora mucronata TaxID=61149 RepID=A0A2P2R484_RHIMU